MPNLNTTILSGLPIFLPPLPEQRRIAEILSTWDVAIALTEQLIAALERRKKGLMQWLLLVDPQQRVPSVRLPQFSDTWETQQLGQIFRRVTRKNVVGCENVLTASAEQGLVSQLDYYSRRVAGKSLEKYYLLKQGEFAYNRSSANGYPYGAIKRLEAYSEGVLSTLYICFALRSGDDGDFFKHFFEAGSLNRELYKIVQVGSRAHGLLNVSLADFFNIGIAIPPCEEQHALAEIFELVDQEIELTVQQHDALKQQKKGLMQRLLTGQVRVSV